MKKILICTLIGMICTRVALNGWFQIHKCEDEKAICYVKSDAISCIKKEPI